MEQGVPRGRVIAAVVLVVLGVASWALAAVAAQPHAYSAHERPPYDVPVTEGLRYSIATSGGLAAANAYGQGAGLQCSLTDRGGVASRLAVTPETNTKALHRIATFVAPVTGRVHVTCRSTGPVYVDDADGTVDVALLLRVSAAVLLAVGLPLGLSVLANRTRRPAPAAP